jgi:hypothetical protein
VQPNEEPRTPDHQASQAQMTAGGSINAATGGVVATGNVDQRRTHTDNRKTKVNFGGVLIAIVAVVALSAGGWQVWQAIEDGGRRGEQDVVAKATGTWTASDGSGTKTFGGNGAQCQGFFYNGGEPLDIGGPMTCTISSAADANGRYSLSVVQNPNRAVYKIAFDSGDHAIVYNGQGTALYELTKF